MKKYFVFLFLILIHNLSNAQVGINNSSPNDAAALDVSSTMGIGFGGLKLPIVTPAQKLMIHTTASSEGTLIYVVDGTYKCLEIYDGISNTWQVIRCTPATVLFTEDFSSYINNTGVDGTGNLGDYPSSVTQWTVDSSNTNISDADDYGKVNSGVFEIQDTNGPLIWQTQSIDISSYSYADFSIDVSEDGSMEYNPSNHISDLDCDSSGTFSDFLDVQYSTDGGTTFTEVPSWNGAGTINHTFVANFSASTVTVSDITGSSLVIRVLMQNWATNEFHRIDNIVVTGR